jgi:hypothetical protein
MGVDVFGLRNKMIITKLKGGLGNQMFQYATGFAVALQNKVAHKIDISGYDDKRIINSDTPRKFELGAFQITSPIALSEEVNEAKYPFGIFSKAFRYFESKILKKYYLDFEPKLFKKIACKIEKSRHESDSNESKKEFNFYLDGFFQSEKNFLEITPQIRQEFTFKKEFFDERVKQLAQILQKENSVSIHVRRGDYVNNKKTNKYHGTCPVEYYQRAIKLILDKTENPTFYIFTDDKKWASENFPNITNISKVKAEDYEEMYLMSLCKHNIIANSSFSWWGAWLNQNSDKIIVAPEKWVNKKPNPHKNIIPEIWIKI